MFPDDAGNLLVREVSKPAYCSALSNSSQPARGARRCCFPHAVACVLYGRVVDNEVDYTAIILPFVIRVESHNVI